MASHIRGAHPEQYTEWTGNGKGATKNTVKASAKSGMAGVINQLELQKAAIERALSALQDL